MRFWPENEIRSKKGKGEKWSAIKKLDLNGGKKDQWKLIAGTGSLLNGKSTMKDKASFALFERIPK